ncbi:hypothetical protein [Salinisphaera dokdonensis]|uniref:hypothetical protein n=1 Tax=Salinisphaera dokdonensis TaxID=454598 RepID=UPI00333EE94D
MTVDIANPLFLVCQRQKAEEEQPVRRTYQFDTPRPFGRACFPQFHRSIQPLTCNKYTGGAKKASAECLVRQSKTSPGDNRAAWGERVWRAVLVPGGRLCAHIVIVLES